MIEKERSATAPTSPRGEPASSAPPDVPLTYNSSTRQPSSQGSKAADVRPPLWPRPEFLEMFLENQGDVAFLLSRNFVETRVSPQKSWRGKGSIQELFACILEPRVRVAAGRSSASVFALLKNLFGDAQMSTLADYIQAALTLNYNGRVVG